MDQCKEQEDRKKTKGQNPGRLVIWASGQKEGRWQLGVRKGGHVTLHQHKDFSLFFSVQHFFPTTSKLFPTRSVRVCMYVCLSECVLEVRFGAEAIKALLKHKLKESEKREEVRRWGREHTQRLSWPAQQSAGSLSILWAQRCEMSQQPNSNIKLSWAAEGKSRMRDVGRDVCC